MHQPGVGDRRPVQVESPEVSHDPDVFQVIVVDLRPAEPDSHHPQKEVFTDQRAKPSWPGWIAIGSSLHPADISQLVRILDLAAQLEDPLDRIALLVRFVRLPRDPHAE